jgi:hypothetical protein
MNFCGRESIDSPASNTRCLGPSKFEEFWGRGNIVSYDTENRRFSSVKRIHQIIDLKKDR